MSDELPERVRERVQIAEWTEQALERAVAEPEPEPANAAEAFVRRTREQAEAEARHEAIVNRAMHEDPSPPVDDPLRAHYQAQRARRSRRRGRIP
jgi:hypothetical protein